MCANIGAVSTLALTVLLLVCGAARAGAAGGTRPRECTGDQQPKLSTNVRFYEGLGKYSKPYGGDFKIYCSGKDIASLKVEENGLPLRAIAVNTSTIKVHIKNLDINTYTYKCIDSATRCKHSVTVEVHPVVSVESARVWHEQDEWRHTYFVPLGEEYEVLCTGHDSATLEMELYFQKLYTQVVNSTTARYKAHADRVEYRVYMCMSRITSLHGEKDYVRKYIWVGVDYYPACKHFRCVIHHWKILECKWQYPTDSFTYTLFYTDLDHDDKGATLLCDRDLAGELNITCKKDVELKGRKSFAWNQNITLLLTTCCNTFCYNETFIINTNSVTKLEKITSLRTSQAISHGAVLYWDTWNWDYSDCDACVYRVEFRLTTFRDGWRQADTSSVCCDGIWCKFVLPLPYPDTEYEVRVSARHKDATDNRVWSEPASVLVRTEPRAACACDAETHAATEPTVATETDSCEACTLIVDSIHENWALKNKIKSSLKEKLAKAKEISEILYKSKELAERLQTLG